MTGVILLVAAHLRQKGRKLRELTTMTDIRGHHPQTVEIRCNINDSLVASYPSGWRFSVSMPIMVKDFKEVVMTSFPEQEYVSSLYSGLFIKSKDGRVLDDEYLIKTTNPLDIYLLAPDRTRLLFEAFKTALSSLGNIDTHLDDLDLSINPLSPCFTPDELQRLTFVEDWLQAAVREIVNLDKRFEHSPEVYTGLIKDDFLLILQDAGLKSIEYRFYHAWEAPEYPKTKKRLQQSSKLRAALIVGAAAIAGLMVGVVEPLGGLGVGITSGIKLLIINLLSNRLDKSRHDFCPNLDLVRKIVDKRFNPVKMAVVWFLLEKPRGASVAEISQTSGYTRSQIRYWLGKLESKGLAEQTSQRGREKLWEIK